MLSRIIIAVIKPALKYVMKLIQISIVEFKNVIKQNVFKFKLSKGLLHNSSMIIELQNKNKSQVQFPVGFCWKTLNQVMEINTMDVTVWCT